MERSWEEETKDLLGAIGSLEGESLRDYIREVSDQLEEDSNEDENAMGQDIKDPNRMEIEMLAITVSDGLKAIIDKKERLSPAMRITYQEGFQAIINLLLAFDDRPIEEESDPIREFYHGGYLDWDYEGRLLWNEY